MEKISAGYTWLVKWLLPGTMSALLAAMVAGSGYQLYIGNDALSLLIKISCLFVLIFLLWMGILKYAPDSVYDYGDYLVIFKGKRRHVLTFSNIKSVSYTVFHAPGSINIRTMRLSLAVRSPLGKTIVFFPSWSLFQGRENDLQKSLRERIQRSKKPMPTVRRSGRP